MRVLPLLLLVGCGPANGEWAGTYEGELTQDDVPCSGQFGKRTGPWAMVLVADGAGVKLDPGIFGCASVPFSVAGGVATARKNACDSTYAVVEVGGTLTLKGDRLDVALKNHSAYKPPDVFECDFTVAGTLTRR